MTEVHMQDSTIVYFNGASQQFRAYVNSSNARGATCLDAYLDQAMTQKIVISLVAVVYFKDI